MKKLLLTILLVGISYFYASPVLSNINAAFLKFDKTSYSGNTGDVIQVEVIVDAGSDQTSSTDAYILYDATQVEAQSVAAGTFFPTVTNNITTGKVYIAAFVDDPATFKTASGTIATIAFKILKNGSGTLTFDCQDGQYNTSKIIKNDINATNIIQCTQNISATVGAGGAGGSGATSTPAASTLPQTGIFDNVSNVAIPGLLLLIIGTALRLVL